MHISMSVFGEKQFSRRLMRVGDRVDDASGVLTVIGEKLFAWTTEQFDTEGGRASGGWSPLAESTLRRKKGEVRVLHETLDLRNSLTKKGGENVFKVTPKQLQWGSTVDYGVHHQFGSDDGEHPPQRRPFELTEADRREIVKDIQTFVMTGLVRPA